MIDLIVVNYRSRRDLDRFVASIATQNLDGELLGLHVVDVDPIQGQGWEPTAIPGDVLTKLHRHSHTIHLENVGYNVACNEEGSVLDGPPDSVIICCNADVEFTAESPDLIDRLVYMLRANRHWGMIGPRQVDHRRRHTAAGIFGPFDGPAHRGWHHEDRGQYSELRDDAAIVAGSVIAIRRDVWTELTECGLFQAVAPLQGGPFLPTKHWWGETYACAHAAAHGYKRVYLGTDWCYHDFRGAPNSAKWARVNTAADRELFIRACEAHDIPHDQHQRTRARR